MFVDIYLLLWRVHELKLLWRVANTDCLPLSVLNLLYRLSKGIIGEGYQVVSQGRLEVRLKECGISVHLLARLRVSGRQLNKLIYD